MSKTDNITPFPVAGIDRTRLPRPAWVTADCVAETQAVYAGVFGHELTAAEAVDILAGLDSLAAVIEGPDHAGH